MKQLDLKSAGLALLSVGMLGLASCKSEQPTSPVTAEGPRAESTYSTQKGVAGGVANELFVAQATVTAIDAPTRHVTLTGAQGGVFSFTAGPEIKNFAQLRVGDKVTATFARRIAITVRSDNAGPGESRAVTASTALKGEKPGALVAEEMEVTAKVEAIDTVRRTATLLFSDGDRLFVPVRPDVDLSRYKVGDSVVTRVTTSLTLLVEAPAK